MTVNVPLLRKVLDHVTAHPDEWRQDWWAQRVEEPCGTAYCIAGHALVMSGHDFMWEDDADTTADYVNDGHAALVATNLLGVSRNEDGVVPLFSPNNTLRDVYRHANELTGGEIPIPDTLPDGS